MKARFLTPASIELADAIGYYENQRPGLGYELLFEVVAAIDKIIQFPSPWTLLSERTRSILLKRSPFGILNRVQEDKIIVAAVTDLRRNPTNWKDLLN